MLHTIPYSTSHHLPALSVVNFLCESLVLSPGICHHRKASLKTIQANGHKNNNSNNHRITRNRQDSQHETHLGCFTWEISRCKSIRTGSSSSCSRTRSPSKLRPDVPSPELVPLRTAGGGDASLPAKETSLFTCRTSGSPQRYSPSPSSSSSPPARMTSQGGGGGGLRETMAR